MKIWFVVQELTRAKHMVNEGLSLVGLFQERRTALDYLRDEVLGPKLFDTINWRYGSHSDY